MSKTVWIVDASLKHGSGTRQVVLLAYATSREDFIRRVEDYFAQTGDQGQFLLAPLDANTYFTRHGKVWLLNRIRTLGNAVKIVPLDDDTPPAMREAEAPKDCLLCHEIRVTPLDDQRARMVKRFAPDELFKLLWPQVEIPVDPFAPQQEEPASFAAPETDPAIQARDNAIFGENPPPLNVYFVADSALVWNFPKTDDRYRCQCLYQGKVAEQMAGAAPYLLEIRPEQSPRLRSLFSQAGVITHSASWADEAGIFIHSRHDFATVYNHLRKLVYIPAENQTRRIFFRFYAPKVLRRYLEIIATHPDKLARFFGADERIIHGLGSGVKDSFIYYQIKDLQNAKPAPIGLSQWESDGMVERRWQDTRAELCTLIRQDSGEIYSQERIEDALDQARAKGYNKINSYRYALCLLTAERQGKDIRTLEARLDPVQSRDPKTRLMHLWHTLSGETHG